MHLGCWSLGIGHSLVIGHWSLVIFPGHFGSHGFWLLRNLLRAVAGAPSLPPGFSVTQDLEQFLFADLAGDVVANSRAHDLSFDRGQTAGPILHQGLADGGKSIAVIENKWTDVLAAAAYLEHLGERHGLRDGFFPKLPGGFKAFLLRFVRGFLSFAKILV